MSRTPRMPLRARLLLAALLAAGAATTARGAEGVPAPPGPAADSAAAVRDSAGAAADSTDAPGPPAPVRFGHRNVAAWPVYFSWDWGVDRSLRVFGPLSSTYREPGYRATYPVWPLAGRQRWRDGRRVDRVLWPILYTERDPARGAWSANLLTPLLSVRSVRAPGLRDVSFLPFYQSRRVAGGPRTLMLTPLRRRVQSPLDHRVDDAWGFLPLGEEPAWWLYRRWDGARGHGWNASWLYGGWASDSTRALYVPPWIGWSRRAADGRATGFGTLVPLYAGYRSRDVRWQAALPSWWDYRSPTFESSGLWPFYSTFTRVRADSAVHSGASVAWPLVTWGHGEGYSVFGLLPFWFDWREGERRFQTAPPLWWNVRGPGSQTRVLAPFYGLRRGPADTTRFVLTWYRRATPGYVHTGLFPLWDHAESADRGETNAALYLWHHAWSPTSETYYLLPLYGDFRSTATGARTRLFGPVLTTGGAGGGGFGLLPVWYSARGPVSRSTYLLPVFSAADTAGRTHLAIVPLSWWRRDRGGWALDLLPLTGYRARGNGRSLLYVLGPTYVRSVDSPTRRTSSVFGWLYRDETRGTRRRTMLQPLWFSERKGEDDVFVSFLGGVLGSYERQGRERQVKVLFVPVRRWTSE